MQMAEADFFVCPPGCGMPHSHNIVEAMSVGTIPITNYASYMTPPLQHGRHCLAFDTIDEFKAILRNLPQMAQPEIRAMRQAVGDYYRRYLDPIAVGNQIVGALPGIESIVVNDETGE